MAKCFVYGSVSSMRSNIVVSYKITSHDLDRISSSTVHVTCSTHDSNTKTTEEEFTKKKQIQEETPSWNMISRSRYGRCESKKNF